MSGIHFYKPIGIAGNALVGKDTLCQYLIQIFKEKHGITAKRCSIAGDYIKKDLKRLISNKLEQSIDFANPKQKEVSRPLMVEYGRFMRNMTQGRYFIECLNKSKKFGKNFVPIIPDIRYAEYKKDEIYWLKKEKKGILIFLERKGIEPANKFEEKNNIILKENADFFIKVPTIKNPKDYASEMHKNVEKILTTYLLGIFQP